MSAGSLRRILVGVELGPRASKVTGGSRCATEEALWLAERVGAELVLLHSTWGEEVYDPLTATAAIVSLGDTPDGRQALEELVVEARGRGVQATLEISEERPDFALVRRVLRGGIDLVVLGKRNEPGLDGRLMGSVASMLMRKCPGPIWVVPPLPGVDPGPVLAATDLTPVGTEVLRLAGWLAGQRGVALHVVHAYQMPFELVHEAARVPSEEHRAHLAELHARAESGVRAQLESAGAGVPAQLHVSCNSPERAIRAAIEAVQPALLAMGTASRGGIAGLLLGHTAERVLGRVECSVLGVKPADFVSPIEA